MTKGVWVQSNHRQMCSGDLDRLITLQVRDITAPSVIGDVDFTMTFTPIIDLWAMVDTKKGTTTFDDTNTERIVDAIFGIPFIPNITSQCWVLWEGERYNIIRVEDLDKRHEWLYLYTTTRGTDQNSVNAQ